MPHRFLSGRSAARFAVPAADRHRLAGESTAAAQLLQTLRIDSEPAVRSNSAWSLGRLFNDLVEPRQRDVVEALLHTMLHDADSTVRDEARLALEQLEQADVLERLQTLVDEGLIS
jgi:HEAT repeat protein